MIFTYIIAPLFIALFTGLAIFLPQEPMMKERAPALAWILPLPCLFLVLLLIYARRYFGSTISSINARRMHREKLFPA